MVEVGYLDTSAFLAVSLHQAEAKELKRPLSAMRRLIASDLLISEASSAFRREGLPLAPLATQLSGIDIITTSLTPEILAEVLKAGYVRGADAHHLSSAFWFCNGMPESLYFISLDDAQLSLAKRLGFKLL